MMPDMPQIEFILRILGRIGFVVLLIGAYRLWRLPILKKHSRQIFWLIVVTSALSLTYSTVTYFILELSTPFYNLLFMAFNVASTWFLALFMNYRAYIIHKHVGRQKLEEYTNQIDKKIAELKESSMSK